MFSAICIQESWLSKGADTSLIQLKGFECIPQGKSCITNRQLIINLHENFKYKLRLELNKYTTWEWQSIEVIRGKTLNRP